ncbi:hypothetical protein M501DRAFT_999555 [Patellaria atrata CBS 101060]|uniref:ASST-domain-containing protein n=1 Tax=Patellaria atrata CBS 101060 TaxID=1346257 RepID=A0A9P4VP10_9PEZI|nr:hypothetical protein M501DRAFT_999555 [Patellaria atrata CBS 101060]
MRLPSLWLLVASLHLSLNIAGAQDTVSTDYDSYSSADSVGTPFQTYKSNTQAKPPIFQINSNQSGLADGLYFLGIDGQPSSQQNFPVIVDMSPERMGSLVWTADYTETFDFRAQTYQGEPVITFWQGDFISGYGHGSFLILNQSYVEIARVSAPRFPGLADFHEFTITQDDTALFPLYIPKQYDLSSVGGPSDGWVLDSMFQEVDIATGELIFEWNATNHVLINETYNTLSGSGGSEEAPFDYFHINSIAKDQNGDYLVSARVMSCIFKISGPDGTILWRLNGRRSDFDVEDAAVFAFQHDARWLNDEQTRMTLFDNGPTEGVDYSRGLLLDVDQDARTVRLITDFTNAAKTFGQYEGSLQAVDPSDENTNFIVGYGSEPFFTECDSEGNILLDVQYATGNVINSYRTYKLPWQGLPLTLPDIHWNKDGNKAYFSWNGATDVEEWVLYTADSSNATTWMNVTTARRTGFETTIDLEELDLEDYIRAKAVNGDGDELAWTRVSDGEELFDGPDDVEESTSSSSSSSSSSSRSSRTSTSSSVATSTVEPTTTTEMEESATSTGDGAAATTSGAAVKLGVREGWSAVAVVVVYVLGV